MAIELVTDTGPFTSQSVVVAAARHDGPSWSTERPKGILAREPEPLEGAPNHGDRPGNAQPSGGLVSPSAMSQPRFVKVGMNR